MITYEKTFNDSFKEMFKRVGLEYSDEFIKDDTWYDKKSWTIKERDDFDKWLRKLLKKRYPFWGKREMDLEVRFFLMMWGWREKDKDER